MKLLLRYKLKSEALQFAIFIAVLIALLLAGLVLYVYTFGYLKEQSKAAIENIQLADSGINFLLEQSEINSDTIAIKSLESNNQKIVGALTYWGIFEKAYTKTQNRQKIFAKSALIGSAINPETAPTLFLKENYNPLSVVGSTRIRGNAYLPTQGVKPGYIAGQSYYGTQLIYGPTKKSSTLLPKLTKHCQEGMQYLIQNYKPTNDAYTIYNTKNEKIVNSFLVKTKNIYATNPIVLENTKIVGNIIIKSDTIITIKKSAYLRDVILIAPNIMIEDEVKGSFQCLASKSIKIGKQCQLAYPSALVLLQDNKKTAPTYSKPFQNQIFVNSKTSIKGIVCYLQNKEVPDFNTQLILEKDSKVKGQVYCQGNFELKGTVSGCVFTNQFISNTAGSVFVNHIFNGTIENENLPELYGGLPFEENQKTILKWLY